MLRVPRVSPSLTDAGPYPVMTADSMVSPDLDVHTAYLLRSPAQCEAQSMSSPGSFSTYQSYHFIESQLHEHQEWKTRFPVYQTASL